MKLKDHLQYQEDVKLDYEMRFLDHIYDVLHPEPRLSEEDIDKMEQDYCNSHNMLTSNINASVSNNSVNVTETSMRRSA
ncbi:hypothetical protein NG767_11270 [Aliarcobacter cryaerophilus]|uniref:hypothetical protein n=1 Tax=Aliarcobacter cryaerophilus TaxID=28198 RepID=UPI003DA4EDDC